LVALVELALLGVEDLLREGVASFLQVPDAIDVAAVDLVVKARQDVQGLEVPPVSGDRLAQRGG
jgi:hypothetical protein